MTEIYNGYWDLIAGDKPKQKVKVGDDYHPKYPATETTGILNSPVPETCSPPVTGYDCSNQD